MRWWLPYHSEVCIEFIYRTEAFEYVVILIESLSCVERGLALVARLGIDLHCSQILLK